jgi:hypothetical protein
MSTRLRLCAAALAGLVLVGCKAAPRQRPIKMGPVDTGPGSVEYARRQLEGAWSLERAQFTDANGQPTDVQADGRLVLDAYGNLSVHGQLREPSSDPTGRVSAEMLEYTGRIVIDADKQEFRLLDRKVKTAVSAATERRLDPAQIRHYRLEGDVLTISMLGPDGRPTAITVFRRAP